MIRIIAIGKKHDKDLINMVERYQQRLRPPFGVQWLLLPYSAHEGDRARDEESAAIMRHISNSEKVILLDERGGQMTSVEFSAELQKDSVTIIIGGAYGVNDELRRRANIMLSLSKMVMPHQIVRLVLIEQIYRAQAIANHHPYHHE